RVAKRVVLVLNTNLLPPARKVLYARPARVEGGCSLGVFHVARQRASAAFGVAPEVARVLQNYSAVHADYADGRRGPGLAHYVQLAKRRLFHFLVPFVVIVTIGIVLAAVQQPIYLAEGKILVESQEIPSDLVRSTVPDSANQRIQVIQQRIMT